MGLDEDGLIGADVFSSYVVDIDIPGDMLRLDSASQASGRHSRQGLACQ